MGQGKRERLHLGFLATVDLDGRGYVGGLLVTNELGRPLEFQCTTPVKPNRTQELLYGPTLRPYVLGELIGGTLVARTSVKPDLLLVESDEQMSVGEHVDMPVARILTDDDPIEPAETVRLGKQLLVPADGVEVGKLQKLAEPFNREADLSEPFDRVREALQETMRAAA